MPPPTPSPPRVPKDDPKAPRSVTGVLGMVMAWNTILTMYSAGVLGVFVDIWFGAGFVQYVWMARADTPVEPHLPYPWLITLVFALLPIPLMRAKHWQVAGFASIPFAVMPWVQLYWLYVAATPTTFE